MKVKLNESDIISKEVYLDSTAKEIQKVLPRWMYDHRRKIAASMAYGEFDFCKFIMDFAIKTGIVEVVK